MSRHRLKKSWRGYHSVCSARQQMGLPPAVVEMEDSILIAAVARRGDLVEDGLRLAGELGAVWPEARLPLGWTSADLWLEGLTMKAADPDSLSMVVSGQVVKHKLDKVQEFSAGEGPVR
ncbi:hypothetical protein [Streptomyces sp. NPDC059743]|uniref:hypothetical protein n=1 Tax=Streptomyces sp. NPDC059743 TaxID=3346928 RepID=UPI003663C704